MDTNTPWNGELIYDDATTQLHQAQENLRKTVEAEIERRTRDACKLWMHKTVRLLEERSTLLNALHECEGFVNCPREVKDALTLAKSNDEQWFKNGMTVERYAQMLRDAFI